MTIASGSIRSVQFISHVWLFATQWTAAGQASLTFTISQRLLRFMPIELVVPSNYGTVLCLQSSLPAFSLSQHLSLSYTLTLGIRVTK